MKYIYVFCYKKSFSLLKKEIFKKSAYYYLINSKWLFDYKNSTYYEKIDNLLKNNIFDKENFNIDNFEGYLNSILNYYLENKNFDEENEKSLNINDIIPKVTKDNGIEHYVNCFLAHEIFIKLINKNCELNKKLLIEPKNIIIKNDIIYLFDGHFIRIGNINEQLLFISKYIFFYEFLRVLEEEKDILISIPIKEYIISRKCFINKYNIQTLKKENNENIGKLLILGNDIQEEDKNDKNIIKYFYSNINKNLKKKLIY